MAWPAMASPDKVGENGKSDAIQHPTYFVTDVPNIQFQLSMLLLLLLVLLLSLK